MNKDKKSLSIGIGKFLGDLLEGLSPLREVIQLSPLLHGKEASALAGGRRLTQVGRVRP